MQFRGRGRIRGPARALYYGFLAIVFHIVAIVLGYQIGKLFPAKKIDRPVEVTWIQRGPENVSKGIQLPPRVPEAPVPTLALPPPEKKKPELAKIVPPPEKARPQPQPKKKEPEKIPELALLPKPPPKPPEAKPPEPPPEPEKPKPQIQQDPRMKKVEVDDEKNVVDEPPPEASYLSDKNRRVAEQTRDTRTNLDQISKGEASASEKSDDNLSSEIGGEDEKVRQLEKAEATSLEKKRLDPTTHNGKDQEAKGLLAGTKGQAATGSEGKNGEGGKPGALAMRNVEGRVAPGTMPNMDVAPSGANDDAPSVAMTDKPGESGEVGRTGREGKAGKPGKRGPKLDLAMDDYKRIIGQEALKDEIEIARRSGSHKKGRWEKKRDRLHAMLENFTPEVKPGNQTALGTRAAPFAVFIARMHRQIHEIWGFGFLEDLDGKSPSDPMNQRSLAVQMEIVLNADGTVDRATIVRPSGVLTFDVAAIDVIENAGPYEEPPAEIRSGNGKIYLHWTFHRDERQCSPYFADPFILDNTPGGGKESASATGMPEPMSIAKARRQAEQLKRGASPTEGGVIVPHVQRSEEQEAAAAAARATSNMPTPDDPAAQTAAIAWLDAFEAGRLDQLVAVSGVPFTSGGTTVTKDPQELARVWRNILDETGERSVKTWKLLSPAGYRAVFGRLPKGGQDGVNKMYLAARFGADWLTLDVVQQSDGSYRITGFTR